MLGASLSGCLQEASAEFAEAVAALPAGALRRAAGDVAGSRALEALFAGPARAKAKRRALGKLLGGLGPLGGEPGGSHVVQAAYAAAVRPPCVACPHSACALETVLHLENRGCTCVAGRASGGYLAPGSKLSATKAACA